MDVLTNIDGDIDYHIRLKGIPTKAVTNLNSDVLSTYQKMFDGESVTFNLAQAKACFKKERLFSYVTLDKFE